MELCGYIELCGDIWKCSGIYIVTVGTPYPVSELSGNPGAYFHTDEVSRLCNTAPQYPTRYSAHCAF